MRRVVEDRTALSLALVDGVCEGETGGLPSPAPIRDARTGGGGAGLTCAGWSGLGVFVLGGSWHRHRRWPWRWRGCWHDRRTRIDVDVGIGIAVTLGIEG